MCGGGGGGGDAFALRRFHVYGTVPFPLFIQNNIFIHFQYEWIKSKRTAAMLIPGVLLHNTMCCVSNSQREEKTDGWMCISMLVNLVKPYLVIDRQMHIILLAHCHVKAI